MNVTLSQLTTLLGSETYREEAISAALDGGVSRLQTVKLDHNAEAELLSISGPTFETVLDLSKIDDPSPEVLRERLDDLLAREMENHMQEVFR